DDSTSVRVLMSRTSPTPADAVQGAMVAATTRTRAGAQRASVRRSIRAVNRSTVRDAPLFDQLLQYGSSLPRWSGEWLPVTSYPNGQRETGNRHRLQLRRRAGALFEPLLPAGDVLERRIELDAGERTELERGEQRAIGDAGPRAGDEWLRTDAIV